MRQPQEETVAKIVQGLLANLEPVLIFCHGRVSFYQQRVLKKVDLLMHHPLVSLYLKQPRKNPTTPQCPHPRQLVAF